MMLTLMCVALLATSGGPVAAGGDQVWLCVPDTETQETVLAVWSAGSSDDQYHVVAELHDTPALMAAQGDTVWMVSSLGADDAQQIRPLVLRAQWDQRLLHWVTTPAAGPSRLAAVAVPGRPVALVAGLSGPVVLGFDADTAMVSPMALMAGQWQARPTLTLPSGSELLSAAMGDDLLVLSGNASGARSLHRLSPDDQAWRDVDMSLPVGASTLAWWEHTPVIGVVVEDRLDVSMIQGDDLVPMAVGQPGGDHAWLVTSGIGLVEVAVQQQEIRVSTINPVTGTASAWRPLVQSDGTSLRAWSIIVTTIIGIAVLLVIVLGRSMNAVMPPAGTVGAPMLARLGAFMVDLIPGLLVSAAIFGSDPRALLASVLQGPLPGTLSTLLVVAGVCWLWQAVWEGATGTSPGKRLCRLWVVAVQGGKPPFMRVIVRTGFRSLIVLAPPLAIIVVLTASGQGIGDVVARTIVVTMPRQPASPET